MTEEESEAYMERYSDLKNAFKNDKNRIQTAITHWK